jgi:sulfate permease, SulP family
VNRITVRGTDGTERAYPLHGGNLVIGRDPACGICLQDAQVSWQHAVLSEAGGTCFIEDLGSSNGTFVGPQRISRQALNAGEIIRIGPYELSLQMRAMPSPTSASEHTMFDAAVLRSAAPAPVRRDQTASPKTLAPDDSWHRWLRLTPLSESYRTANLRQEVIAGLTVAALLVPQGMAYALLAGLPPVMGLYASILPMIVYALAGSGRQTSVGPVTVDSLMLVLGLGTLATAGTPAFIALALLVTAMIGAIQLAMGALRLGFLVNFLSYPVLAGFTSAIAVITVIGQLKHVLGVSGPQHPELYRTAMDVVTHAGQANPITVVIALGCSAALWAAKRWAPTAPGPLALVIVCTILAYALGLDGRGVSVLGPVTGGWPHLSVPGMHWIDIRQLLPLAFTMALVGFAQTISVGKALGNRFGYDIDANRELTALGLSNLTSSVSQGYAVSGSLARSALNAAAGARTQFAAIVSALCVGITTLFFTPLFHYLPNATLAAILIVSSLRLIDTREIRYLFKVKITEGVLLAFTFGTTLALGIMPGLLLGIVASILLFITLNTRPNTAILGRLPNTNIFRNVVHFPEAETIPGLVILRIDASLYFANTVFLKEKVHEICRQHAGSLRALILDASAVNDLDSSADTALHQLSAEFKQKGIEFYIAGVKAPVRDVMKRSGLYAVLGSDHFFFTIDAAVKRFQDRTRPRQ